MGYTSIVILFFCNETATAEIDTLSLHDALPIWAWVVGALSRPGVATVVTASPSSGYAGGCPPGVGARPLGCGPDRLGAADRSEEHTSELQSRQYLVCRLLLEKKKNHSLQ